MDGKMCSYALFLRLLKKEIKTKDILLLKLQKILHVGRPRRFIFVQYSLIIG